MGDTVQCATHGDNTATYICHHLNSDALGLGFNRDDPTGEKPYPDAWCDNCELIRAAHGGWDEQSGKLTTISLVCAECYKRARIRNTKTDTSLDALSGVRWKCGNCDEWHTGPILDVAYDHPDYWSDEHASAANREAAAGAPKRNLDGNFLDADFCSAEGKHYFARGYIELPILGTDRTFCWGVWGSLSRESMEKALAYESDPANTPRPPGLFSWLGNNIRFYPEIENVKMLAHFQQEWRPRFEIQPADSPLALDSNNGIAPSRVVEIMRWRLPELRLPDGMRQ